MEREAEARHAAALEEEAAEARKESSALASALSRRVAPFLMRHKPNMRRSQLPSIGRSAACACALPEHTDDVY